MSNFYPNNNIENLLNYNNLQRQNINHHICFGCILVSLILFIIYDLYNKKSYKSSTTTQINKKKSCTTCQGNTNNEEHDNLILKYETKNFREIFNKSEEN